MNYENTENNIEALTIAVRLAVNAPTREKSEAALNTANKICGWLEIEEVEAVMTKIKKENPDFKGLSLLTYVETRH